MSRSVVPGPELLEVFEMNNRPAVVLSEVKSIEKVRVNRCRDDPMRRE